LGPLLKIFRWAVQRSKQLVPATAKFLCDLLTVFHDLGARDEISIKAIYETITVFPVQLIQGDMVGIVRKLFHLLRDDSFLRLVVTPFVLHFPVEIRTKMFDFPGFVDAAAKYFPRGYFTRDSAPIWVDVLKGHPDAFVKFTEMFTSTSNVLYEGFGHSIVIGSFGNSVADDDFALLVNFGLEIAKRPKTLAGTFESVFQKLITLMKSRADSESVIQNIELSAERMDELFNRTVANQAGRRPTIDIRIRFVGTFARFHSPFHEFAFGRSRSILDSQSLTSLDSEVQNKGKVLLMLLRDGHVGEILPRITTMFSHSSYEFTLFYADVLDAVNDLPACLWDVARRLNQDSGRTTGLYPDNFLKLALARATDDQIREAIAALMPRVGRLLAIWDRIGAIRGLARIIDCRPEFRQEVLEKFPMGRSQLVEGGLSDIKEVIDIFYPQEN
jgi:hypothetical protein